MSVERQPRPKHIGPCRSWKRVRFVFIFMAMMGSHLEGFKQGSDLTDLIYMIERFLRLPHREARVETGSQLGQVSRYSMRWLGLG